MDTARHTHRPEQTSCGNLHFFVRVGCLSKAIEVSSHIVATTSDDVSAFSAHTVLEDRFGLVPIEGLASATLGSYYSVG